MYLKLQLNLSDNDNDKINKATGIAVFAELCHKCITSKPTDQCARLLEAELLYKIDLMNNFVLLPFNMVEFDFFC